MSRNDIFSTSFRPLPPKLSYTRDRDANSGTDSNTPPNNNDNNDTYAYADRDDPFAPSSSSLNRSRTTGQSWLRARTPRMPPPPLRLHHSLSVHIADKPSVYVLPDRDDRPPSPPGSEDDGRTAGRPSIDASQDITPLPLAPGSGPTRTSSFFDLPSSRLSPPHSLAAPRVLTSSSSDFSSAYSTRSNPALMEELPWEGLVHREHHGRHEEEGAREAEAEERREPELKLRLREERRFFLGEGRFAKVWVAAFRRRRSSSHHHQPPSDPDDNAESPASPRTRWRLCAAKQPLPDPESELLVRREAFFLRHLSHPRDAPPAQFLPGRRYIVRLLGVVRDDEGVEGEEVRVHECAPPPLPLVIPGPDGVGGEWKRPILTSQTTISPTTATEENPQPHTPAHLRHLFPVSTLSADPGRLAPPTPTSLRHARSVSDTFSSSLLSPTPHARARSRPSSPTRAWGTALPPTPTSPQHQPPHPQRPPRLTLLLSYHPQGSLASLLHTSPHLLTPALYTSLAHQLALALAYVHSCGVLHTDIKPQNVLVARSTSTSTPGGLEARLADFGSALLLPPYALQAPSDGLGLGTPGYTAPELLLPPNSGTFTYSADIFSLGVVLGVLLFGREPYAGLVGRGRGRGEMMHWARRGEYWVYEEGERLEEVGLGSGESGAAQLLAHDEGEEEDEGRRLGREEMDELLREDGESDSPPESPPPPQPSYTLPPSPPSSPPRPLPPSSSPSSSHPSPSSSSSSTAPYSDSSPPIYFLGPSPSHTRVRAPDELVGLVKRMCSPRREERPGMGEVVRVLGGLRGVYE